MSAKFTIALAGNPNAGKSTIFNALTGGRQHVGNWPGKTVEKKEGVFDYNGLTFTLIDLPGAYSLSAFSLEEEVTRDFIIRGQPAVVVNVADAANLERNLYLTTQIMETGIKMILVLNMMDVAGQRGFRIDAAAMSRRLGGMPVIAATASRSEGLVELKQTLAAIVTAPAPVFPDSPEWRSPRQAMPQPAPAPLPVKSCGCKFR